MLDFLPPPTASPLRELVLRDAVASTCVKRASSVLSDSDDSCATEVPLAKRPCSPPDTCWVSVLDVSQDSLRRDAEPGIGLSLGDLALLDGLDHVFADDGDAVVGSLSPRAALQADGTANAALLSTLALPNAAADFSSLLEPPPTHDCAIAADLSDSDSAGSPPHTPAVSPAARDRARGGRAARRKDWSADEDETILLGVRELGPRWRTIAARLPLRSDDAVRNRWLRLRGKVEPNNAPRASRAMRDEQRRVGWSTNEDAIILQAVADVGNKWGLIAKMLPSERTEHAIRNRHARIIARAEEEAAAARG